MWVQGIRVLVGCLMSSVLVAGGGVLLCVWIVGVALSLDCISSGQLPDFGKANWAWLCSSYFKVLLNLYRPHPLICKDLSTPSLYVLIFSRAVGLWCRWDSGSHMALGARTDLAQQSSPIMINYWNYSQTQIAGLPWPTLINLIFSLELPHLISIKHLFL